MRMTVRMAGYQAHLRLDTASALDLAGFVVEGIDLSPGAAIPSDGDPRIDHALRGFLFTCGPDHIRHPEPLDRPGGPGAAAAYPLHGSLAGTPVAAEAVTAIDSGVEARFSCLLADGGRAEIARRWTTTEDGWVRLEDRVTNPGTTGFPVLWMYHLNLAGHLLGQSTGIEGAMLPGGRLGWRFGEGPSAHCCLLAHGTSQEGRASVRLGPLEALGGLWLEVAFPTDTLPFLQMWRCQRDGANVLSLEPVSHRIAKRPDLAQAGELPDLPPGGSVDFALAFRLIRRGDGGG